MRDWPSIVPGTPEDYFIVVNHFGRFGTAFAETDLDRGNYETTIVDLIGGQHSDPLRVIMFNAASGLKGVACRQGWGTSLIVTSARIAS